jgi:hypothetical protein
MSRRPSADDVRLPWNEEPVAAVTILDANGSIVRVVPATEFRQAPTIQARRVGRPEIARPASNRSGRTS